MRVAVDETLILTEKFILNSDFTIILPIMWVVCTVESVDWIFLKTTDQSYLFKIVLTLKYVLYISVSVTPGYLK